MFYPTQERCARSLYAIRVCVEGIAVRYSGAEGGKVFFHHPVCSLSLFSINMGQRRWPPVDFTLSPSLEARETSSSSRRRCLTSAARKTATTTIKFYYKLLFRRRKGPVRTVGLVDKYHLRIILVIWFPPRKKVKFKIPITVVCVFACVCVWWISHVDSRCITGETLMPFRLFYWARGFPFKIKKVLYLVVSTLYKPMLCVCLCVCSRPKQCVYVESPASHHRAVCVCMCCCSLCLHGKGQTVRESIIPKFGSHLDIINI